MAKRVGATERIQAILRDPRKGFVSIVAGISGITLLAFLITLPPAPAQYSIILNVKDVNGGVFASADNCDPRSGYEWINAPLIVTPRSEVVPAPVISTFRVDAARTDEDVCQFKYSVTVASPSAGPLEQIMGSNRVPSEIGLHRLSLGTETLGTENFQRNAGREITLTRTITVTSNLVGLIEVGFKADWCKAGPGIYPDPPWNCGWTYYGSDPSKFSSNKKKQTCSGRLSFADLRAGAVVTVAGDNGSVRGALVQASSLFSELTLRGVNVNRTTYYLYSKESEVMLCPLAWSIPSVPFSPSGYTITVAKRTPIYVPASALENPLYLNTQLVGDRP